MRNRASYPIVSITNSGIGNRLKSLLSTMRLTDDFYIYWPKNRCSGANFSDLFENDIEVFKLPFLDNWFYKNTRLFFAETWFGPNLVLRDEDHISRGFGVELYDSKKGRSAMINDGTSIDFQYERIPKSVQQSYLEKVNSLVPVEYVRREVEEFSGRMFDADTVGVQIRTWKDEVRRQSMFSEDSLTSVLNELEGKNFFLSSDDQAVIDRLIARYPGRCFFYNKRVSHYEPGSSDASSVAFAQDCLIDMFLLGQTNLIVGSHLSTFSECAWWFGRCKPKVKIIEPNIA